MKIGVERFFLMLLRACIAATFFAGGALALFPLVASADNSRWLTAYYATYNYGVMTTSDVDYSLLTHVIYWPVLPKTNGTLNTTPFGLSSATFSNGAIDLVSRAHQAGAKALIGIGGDKSSGATTGFQGATADAHRAAFVSNIVALMQQYGFDGVDINWEQIRNPQDNARFTSFITDLRAALNQVTPLPLLTMAPEVKMNGGRPDLIGPIYQNFDQINIQTYLMSGPYCGWETWFSAPLNNGGATFATVPSEQLPSMTNAIQDYVTAGVPKSKLSIGIQTDAVVWQGGSGTDSGGVTKPLQTWNYGDGSCPGGSDPGAPQLSTIPYRQMVATYNTANGYGSHFDSTADQTWLGLDSATDAKDTFVTVDDAAAIAAKGNALSAMPASGVGGDLGGAFLFELSGDFMAGAGQQHPLATAANHMTMLLPGLTTNLTGAAGTNSATISWSAAPGAGSYNVYFVEGQSGPLGARALSGVTDTQATVTGLTGGQTYYFAVTGVNKFGEGTQNHDVQVVPAGGAAALPPPTNVAAVAGNQQVTLSWTAAAGADKYYVFESTTAGGEKSPWVLATSKTSNVVISGLTNGTTYYFTVKSYASASKTLSASSSEVSATPSVPFSPPTNVAAVAGNQQVTLSWTAAAGADKYYVFESTTAGGEKSPWVLATSKTSNVVISGLTNGTTYYFTVKSYASASKTLSASSSEVSATPSVPFSPPTNVAAVAGNQQVTLSWTAAADADKYYVFESTTAGGEKSPWVLATSKTSNVVISGLTNGTTYYFTVKSYASASKTLSASSSEVSATPSQGGVAVWSPDYYGQRVFVKLGAGTSVSTVTLEVQPCNPNSVVVNSGKLYVVCNGDYGHKNEVLVYDAAAIKGAAAGSDLTIGPMKTITNDNFASLIGSAFDAQNNLWVTSAGNNEVFSISAASLNSATPTAAARLIGSPDAPAGLVFDTDGSLWVVDNTDGGGLVVNFTTDQLSTPDGNATPRYCIAASNVGAGCQFQNKVFKSPEGVALFDGKVWISNNSTGANGDVPGRELVGISVADGALQVSTVFGSSQNGTGPFSCPGGLFGTPAHLWVSDESYGEAPAHCGADGDVGSAVGGTFSFTPQLLEAQSTDINQILRFANILARPGFGGIYVENDN